MKRPAPPLARRALTRGHLAFYRAVIEGVDARRAWDQYLQVEGPFDDATCDAMLSWVRQALIGEAMATGQPELIGLFRRDPRRLRSSGVPTLAEFAARFSDAGEFSEAELLALWHDTYGDAQDRRTQALEERRRRLSRRLRDALPMLERAVRRAPRAGDPVGQWLSPPLAQRLIAAGLERLGDVQLALASRRRRRWGAVPGVGQAWADRIAAWLRDSGLAPEAVAAPDPPAPLQPLEQLLASPHDVLRADAQQLQRWLDARAANPHTARAYRRAAERLLLWCHHERRLPLAGLTPADGIHYRTWLQEIGGHLPAEWAARGWRLDQAAWIGIRGKERQGALWRPFGIGRAALAERAAALARGKRPQPLLDAASVAQELAILRALFRFLRDTGTVGPDPWPRAAAAGAVTAAGSSTRRLTRAQWRMLVDTLDGQAGERPARLRAAIWLAFGCGLRPAEIVGLTLGGLRAQAKSWQLVVPGRAAPLPLPSPARQAVWAYLACIGLDPATLDAHDPSRPLLRAVPRRREAAARAVGLKSLHDDLKRHLAGCADRLAADGDAPGAAALRRASARWLRGTGAWLGLESGALDVAAVHRLLGHRSTAALPPFLAVAEDDLADRLERLAAL